MKPAIVVEVRYGEDALRPGAPPAVEYHVEAEDDVDALRQALAFELAPRLRVEAA